jgi:hypothetical protein
MKQYIFFLMLTLLSCSCFSQVKPTATDLIEFEISPYNLLFTKVEINNREYTALIDFGDFAQLQISTSLIAQLELQTEKSDIMMTDINGNQYALEKGQIAELKVGGISENNVTFFSAENEIDAVSKQVGTEFQVVIGFGFFKTKSFILDFVNNRIHISQTKNKSSDFSIPVNTDYGYLIANFNSKANDELSLLFDTGTPISRIDANMITSPLKDSTVTFQNTQFPSKILNVKSKNNVLTLNMENNDVSELAPLGVVGIYGVNDMLGKVFIYSPEDKMLTIKHAGRNGYE